MPKSPLLHRFSTKRVGSRRRGSDSAKDGNSVLATVRIMLSSESQSVLPGIGSFGCSHHTYPQSPPTVCVLFALCLRNVDLALEHDEQEASRTFLDCVCHSDMCSCINSLTRAHFQSGRELTDDRTTKPECALPGDWETHDCACVVNHASCHCICRIPCKSERK